jgi:eukaryotic-like serine/threonine-protein kinase
MLDLAAMEPMKRPSVTRFGNYEVNLDSGELRKAGIRIRLQQQPFKVLEVLLEHSGEVVTREELRASIWPDESFGDFDQAVNVAVAKLRTALGDSAENPRFIETLPRRGYRFVALVQSDSAQGSGAPGSGPSAEPTRDRRAAEPRFNGRRRLVGACVVTVIVLSAIAILVLRPGKVALDFHRVSFGKGAIRSARFTADGQSIVYGAAWDGKPPQVFWAQAVSPESRSYPMPDADILSISSSGQMAVLLNRRAGVGYISHGTLALMPLTGAAPREIADDVQDADWDPQGKNLSIVHWVGNRCHIEYPIGKVIYRTIGGHWLSDVRISPRGNLIAFMDHPLEGDDAGTVQVVDLEGDEAKILTSHWVSVHGLAWDPSGDSIWFSASDVVGGRERPRAIYQVTLDGKLREIFHESGDMTIHDISHDRRLLATRDLMRYETMGQFSGESRDLSWLNFSRTDDLSADGSSVLITVEGEAAGKNYEVYLRKTDGSAPIKLGEGYGSAISPDGTWALAVAPFGTESSSTAQFMLLPVGKGKAKVLTHDSIAHLSGTWFPDGKRIVFRGNEVGHSVRSWVQDLAGGAPKPITPEGVSGIQLSPDGKSLCAVDAEGKTWIYPVAGGKPAELKGIEEAEFPVRWATDGRSLFVAKTERLPVSVYRVYLESGRRELVQQLAPVDPAGVLSDVSSISSSVFATPDGRSYVYSYFRLQSDLYIATMK